VPPSLWYRKLSDDNYGTHRKPYKILVSEPERYVQIGKCMHRRDRTIPTIHREGGCGSVNWIHLQSSGYRPVVDVVNAVMNIWVLLIEVRLLAK
jgi:hypothetical protein